MAENLQESAATAHSDKNYVHVKVVSPSLPSLTLPSVPVSTTVSELKAKICQIAPTHPHVLHQRLIYRGHPLLRSDLTVKDLFTQQTINENDSITIHLVMPPAMPTQLTPNSSSQPHAHLPHTNPLHSFQGTPGARNIPHRNQPVNWAPQNPNGQPHIPQPPLMTSNSGQASVPQAQFPPHLQQTFNQFQAIQQQLAAQLASLHNHPIIQGQTVQRNGQIRQSHMYSPQTVPQPQVQQFFTQQQQQPPQGVAGVAPPVQTPIPQQQAYQQTFPHMNGHLPPNLGIISGPANTNTVVREHIGPDGQRWSTVTQFGTMNPPNIFHPHQHPAVAQDATLSPRSATPNIQNGQSAAETSNAIEPEVTQSFPEAPNQSSSENASTPISTSTNPSTDNAYMPRAAREIATSQRESHGAETSAVYVLSSPSGPQALLVSPNGNYTAPWPILSPPTFANLPHPGNLVPFPTGSMPNLGLHQTNIAPQATQPQQDQAANAQQAQNAMQLARMRPQIPGQPNPVGVAGVNQQQAQQARDLARVIMPLGGHLWLLIRLFGFVYFFTHGASWSRTLFLIAVATLVFIGQTGIFRPLVQGVWEPIRRHADNLVPLVNNGQPRDGNVGAAQNNAIGGGLQGATREPTPQEAAQRLLEQQQDDNIFRQGLRRIERAIALFIASLVPGVGERHIAAREAAEAARQGQIREREEQLRREEVETRQQQERVSGAVSDGTGADANISGGDGSATQEPVDAAQSPLVEV
ncbi:MAG: hypothetical protein Q9217_003001 [Psora testacea]